MTDQWKLGLLVILSDTLGIIVVQVDGRGSAGRGMSWSETLTGAIGDVDVNDQLAALEHVVAMYHVDVNRIAVMGQNYGGYLALKMIVSFKSDENIITCAIVRSPVVQWPWQGNVL